MSEEKIKVGKWNIPKELYEQYVKFRLFADSYALHIEEKRPVPMMKEERRMRWLLCVKKVMEIHRKICEIINVPYSEELDDEFYKAFHRSVEKTCKREKKAFK